MSDSKDKLEVFLNLSDHHGWMDAISDYQDGNPESLAAMLRKEPMQEWARLAFADVVEAAPLKRARGKNRQKVTASVRRRAAMMMRAFDYAQQSELSEEQSFISEVAQARKAALEELADEADSKPDTIRKIARKEITKKAHSKRGT